MITPAKHLSTSLQKQRTFSQVAIVFRAALLLGASGGFLLACILTVTSTLGIALGAWWSALAQAHGDLQLFGWAGLFVIGVSLHFLPRLRGTPLVAVWPVRWIVGLQAAALCLRALIQPLLAATDQQAWRAGLVASGILEFIALSGVVLLLGLTFRQGAALEKRPAFGSTFPLIACAFICLELAAIVNLVNMFRTVGIVPETGDLLCVTLGLSGFLIPMALGMSARSLPMYAGLDAFPPRPLILLACAYIAGLLATCLGIACAWQAAESAGNLLIGGVLIAFVLLFLRTMRSRGKLPARVERLAPEPRKRSRAYRARISQERGAHGPFVALVASAYLWAILAGLFLLINGFSGLAGFAEPIVADAIRHSLTVGFLTLLICGIAPRMLPGFAGGKILSAKLVSATFWLGNLAALLRVGSILLAPWLTLGNLNLSQIAFGCSGVLGLTLAICLALNIWPALAPARITP